MRQVVGLFWVKRNFGAGTSMIYLGTEAGLYRWSQGGNWPVYHSLQERRIRTVLAGGEGRLTVIDDAGKILESLNNGASWKSVDLPVGVSSITASCIGGSPLTMIIATRGEGVYCRAVGNPWWSKISTTEADNAKVTSLCLTSTASPVLLAGVSGTGLYRTADGGKSWSKVEGTPPEIHVIRSIGSQVVLGSSQGAWISSDSGASFTQSEKGLEAVPQVYSLDINPKDPKWILAGAAAASSVKGGIRPQGFQFGLYESKDGGKTWARVIKRGLPELVAF
ncbi:MAG: VPS10 domain-containing protein, partial [Isosphaeraceae bacterium]